MNFEVKLNKKRQTESRKMRYLPRIGIYLDFAGYEFSFKQVPFVESFLNLIHLPLTPYNIPGALQKILRQQLKEIDFPSETKKQETIDTTFRKIEDETTTKPNPR